MTSPASDAPAQPASKTPNALERYIAKRDALNEIALDLVLERLGADSGQDGDGSKWKIPAVGNIITRGQTWKNVNTNVHKGFGGVSLVRHALDMEHERDAMKWMEAQFGAADAISIEIRASASSLKRHEKSEFDPPEPMEHMWERVRDYLVAQRGLPPSLVDQMHEAGTLYGGLKFDKIKKRHYGQPLAVFMGPASAELREIVPDGFKGCCEGSDPDNSCFQVPHSPTAEENILGIQEAAVDSLSYRALFPGRFSVSTNGVGRFPLQYRLMLEAMEGQYGVRAAFDADMAGDVGAQHLFNGLFMRMTLANRLKVEPEVVDAWLMSGVVDVTPSHSPHELFFNTGWAPSLAVRERSVETDADGKVREVWRETTNNGPPTVRLNVSRSELHPNLPKGHHDILVSERAYNYITQHLKLMRDRPVAGKDWNDELRRLGSAYAINYERAAKKDFADGVPALPAHLEALRTQGVKVIASPAKPALGATPTPDNAAPQAIKSFRPTTF